MGLPLQITSTFITGSSAVIAASQTLSGVAALTLTNAAGVSLDAQRRVLVTQTGTNSGSSFIISGTNGSGTTITETLLSATASALTSSMDFKSVTAIAIGGAPTASVSVGTVSTGGMGSTPWQAANNWVAPYNMLISVNLAAGQTATYALELTQDKDPCGIRSNAPLTAVTAFGNPNTGMGTVMTLGTPAANTSGQSFIITSITAWRITTTTGQGALTILAMDAGVGVG